MANEDLLSVLKGDCYRCGAYAFLHDWTSTGMYDVVIRLCTKCSSEFIDWAEKSI